MAQRFLIILTLTIMLLSFAGCVTPPPAGAPPPPAVHLWDYIFGFAEEEQGFGTYTYVLAGRDASDVQAAARYASLIKAIHSSTTGLDAIPVTVDRSRFNLFLIPAKRTTGFAAPEPDFDLSKLLLTAFATSWTVPLDKPGPFLITLPHPVRFMPGESTDILYIDLTNTHDLAIREVVRTYKNRISNDALEGIERLQSLRLTVLNMALIAEDNIAFAKAAYAGLKDISEEN